VDSSLDRHRHRRTLQPSVVSCGIAVIHCVLALGFLAVIVMAIMKALKGGRMRFPVISEFADTH